uniref:Uncharacterized protein n=1 Tax=Globodera rostochiensis TaxID=31243 RepID=A0A914GVQ0_GLORO
MAVFTLKRLLHFIFFLQFPVLLGAFQLRFPPPSHGRISLAQFVSLLNDEQLRASSYDDPIPIGKKRAFDRLDVSALGFNDLLSEEEPLSRWHFVQQPLTDEEEQEEKPVKTTKHRRWARQMDDTKNGRVNGFGLFGSMRLK